MRRQGQGGSAGRGAQGGLLEEARRRMAGTSRAKGNGRPQPAASPGLREGRQQQRAAVELVQAEGLGVLDGRQVQAVRREGRRAALAVAPGRSCAIHSACSCPARPAAARHDVAHHMMQEALARSVKQETGRVPRCPGDAGGAPDAWPGTATNGSWRNRARPAGRRPRAHGGHVQRLEAPAGAPGPQRGTHAAAPQRIDVGARTGRETGVEIVRNLPGPLHGDRRRQEGVHAAHPGLHAPVQRRVQVHDLHGAVHAGVGATRADGGHRARHAAEAGQRGLQRVLHGLAVRLRLPTWPSRRRPAQCDSGHRSGAWERQGGAVHPKAARPGRG